MIFLKKWGYSVNNLIRLAFLLGCDYPILKVIKKNYTIRRKFWYIREKYLNEGIIIEYYNFKRQKWNKICFCSKGSDILEKILKS